MTPMLFSSGATPVAPEGGTFTPGAVPGASDGASDGSATTGNMDALAAFDVALLDVLDRAAATAADASNADGDTAIDVVQAGVDGTAASAFWPVAPPTIGAPAVASDGDEDAADAVDNGEESGETDFSSLDIVVAQPWPLLEDPVLPSQWSIPVSIRGVAIDDGPVPDAAAAGSTTAVRDTEPQSVLGDARSSDQTQPTHGTRLDDATIGGVPTDRANDGDAHGMRENGRSMGMPRRAESLASEASDVSRSALTDRRGSSASSPTDHPVDSGRDTGRHVERSAALGTTPETQLTPDERHQVASGAERAASHSARAHAFGGATPAVHVSRDNAGATMSAPVPPPAPSASADGAVSAAAAAVWARASAQAPDTVASESGQDTPGTSTPATSFGTVPSPEVGETASSDGRRGRGRDQHGVASEAILLRRSASLEARLAPPPSFALGSAAPLSLSALTPQALAVAAGGLLPFDMPAPADNLSRLVQSIRVQARDSVSQASVRLNPEHLGEVTMTVRVEGGIVNAVVRAESGDVRQWLRGQEDSIRASLAEQGLTLDELVVDEDGGRGQQRQADDEMPRRPRTRVGRTAAATFDITA